MHSAAANAVLQAGGWFAQLADFGQCSEQEPMHRRTTLAVGGPARWFFRPHDQAGVVAAMQACPADVPVLPLGRGSNMLLPDAGFDGLVMDLAELNQLRLDGHMVQAGAGVRMSRLARLCAEHGLSGCEFMATVPGDVGGGVAMNAGCFSQCVADRLVFVDVVLRSGGVCRIQADALQMRYRHSCLPEASLVVAAGFELCSGEPEVIRERMRDMRSRRSSTQPLSQPNCGSVFKNPEGDHAARLIEAAGLKGCAIGGARVSEQHANFIVNDGAASSADVMALIQRIQQVVELHSGIVLEPEVRMLGWDMTGPDTVGHGDA